MQKKESRFKKLSHTIYECKYHIHLVVSIPPAYSVSNFMGCLKGKISLRLFSQYEKLGKRYGLRIPFHALPLNINLLAFIRRYYEIAAWMEEALFSKQDFNKKGNSK